MFAVIYYANLLYLIFYPSDRYLNWRKWKESHRPKGYQFCGTNCSWFCYTVSLAIFEKQFIQVYGINYQNGYCV